MTVCELPVVTVELISSMPTMLETASSILRVTSVSICEGGTPEYPIDTMMNGKEISGSSWMPSFGKLHEATHHQRRRTS